MSQEVFALIQGMNWEDLKTQLALQCAPVIAGLKISNLLMIPNEKFHKILEILGQTGFQYRIMLRSGHKTTILLYEQQELERYIAKKEVRQFLSAQGYETTDLSKILDRFVIQYRNHRMNQDTFPHEMGVFLGYPLVDVLGFMENEGKNFLYNGYWKVYGNLQETVGRFQSFQKAEANILSMVAAGRNIPEIVAYYHNKYQPCIAG